jgi:hypothetical protein
MKTFHVARIREKLQVAVFFTARMSLKGGGQTGIAAAGRQGGFLRVDTVHQGEREGSKGVHHINAVAEVTQWQ